MKILLAQAYSYLYTQMGAAKATQVLMEKLAERGHTCRIVAPAFIQLGELLTTTQFLQELRARDIEVDSFWPDAVIFQNSGVEIHATTDSRGHGRSLGIYMIQQIKRFEPDWIIVPDEHKLIDLALETSPKNVLSMFTAAIPLPFGPQAREKNPDKTERLRQTAGTITISHFLKDYLKQWGGIDSEVIQVLSFGDGPFPNVGRFDEGFVTMVNPCAVKGVSIFLALARQMPDVQFGAVPGWGSSSEDLAAVEALPNVTLLSDDIDEAYAQTRILLVPSLWQEIFGMVAVEGMLRGIPVLASNVGGLPEAKLGIDYVLPVRPIERWEGDGEDVDESRPVVPEQDIEPWLEALQQLLSDRAHYEQLSRVSRETALAYVEGLETEPLDRLERYLKEIAPTARKTALTQDLSPEQRARLALQLSKKKKTAAPRIPRLEQRDNLPLSFAQQRLWFLARLVPDSPFYNVPTVWQFNGDLDVAILGQSLSEIVRRHEVLRTTFPAEGGQPYQVIAPPAPVSIPVFDLQRLTQAEQGAEIQRIMAEDTQQAFDLARGPLLRATLLHLGPSEHVFLLNCHHIIFDGWSTGVFIRELTLLYNAFSAGEPSPLSELPIQYADFACWQRQLLQGRQLERHLDYWKKQLDGIPVLLDLPTDYPRPEIQGFRGTYEDLMLPGHLSEALRALGEQQRTTLFMVMLTAFGILLYRYTNQEDIVVGTGIASRNYREIEELIGFFVNVLPIRLDLSGNPSFRELLQQVRAISIDAYTHQDLPFEKLVEELQPERKLSHAPIFQVSFVHQNFPELPSQDGGLAFSSLHPAAVSNRTAKFDLTLYLVDNEDNEQLVMEYNSDLFNAGTIRRMLDHFQVVLEHVSANPEARVAHLPVMTAEERKAVLVDWNETWAEYPAEKCLHHLYEAWVKRSPHSVALVCGDEELTYRELNRLSNKLAHHLQKLGVGPETLVGVYLERSIDTILALLGILKAGGAYVPFDPDYPPERVAFMLADSRTPILVTKKTTAALLPIQDAQLVCWDTDWPAIVRESGRNPTSRVTASNLAYIIYTSGSTGQPKGTMLSHRGVCNLVQAQRKAFAIQPDSCVFQMAALSFDASVSEIFVTLLSGATLVLPTPETALPDKELVDLLRRQAVTVMTCTPSVWAILPEEALPQLKTVISAGEACPASVVARWAAGRRFINAYGPTEASVCATLGEVSVEGKPAIGRPIDNVQIYLLDRRLQPVPLGVPGEIYIGGVGLARGYWQQPALTAERFVPNPFGSEAGARLYRTGDLARYLPDGRIDFLERVDHQVKIRGFRVELGEIETVLEQHPVVREAVVIPHVPEGGEVADKQLVAYVALNKDVLQKLEREIPELDIHGEQISQWQYLFDDNYGRDTSSREPTFNIAGWNSSYTGLPISEEEMREWVDQAVTRILAQQPRRVLEIGCGTGLLLFRVAPHCGMYWGTDFSATALEYIKRTMAEAEMELPQVTLSQQMANDFTGIPAKAFDTIILNSVVQYFPSVDYLVSVLEQAAEAVQDGGCIFIGDVRSLPLLETFHASVQTYKAHPSSPLPQLWQLVQRRIREEEELVIDPAFFAALKQHVPRVSHVEMRLKRGHIHNELTKFRYDVSLYVGDTEWPLVKPDWLDWQKEQLAVSSVRRILSTTEPDLLAIAGVPNVRLQADLQTRALLTASKGSETVGELREMVLYGGDAGLDPEVFWYLSDESPYVVDITWSDGDYSSYDVVFRNQSAQSVKVIKQAETGVPPLPWHHYANNPLQRITSLKLAPFLRLFLEDMLPGYMVPAFFVMLDSFPLSPSGKVDRQALPSPSSARRSVVDGSFVIPRDPIELQLTYIWEDVLEVHPIGVTDNFFELGGHSLLAVDLMDRIKVRFGKELPLSILFQYPTVEHLASILRREIGFVSESALVAVQPNGSKPPFFCVHPAGGNVICYTDLARRLGPDQPFFGLQDPGLARESGSLTSVEAMATHYIEALRAVQPGGPYLIGGWSFGALVALEMAQQLREKGEEIALLAVFDAVAPRVDGESDEQSGYMVDEDTMLQSLVFQEVGRTFGVSIDIPPAGSEHQATDVVTYILEQLQKSGIATSQREIVRLLEYGRRYVQVYKRNMTAQARYVSRPYTDTVTLIRIEDAQEGPGYDDALYGWGSISTLPVDVYLVPGTHHTILYEPYVSVVTEHLRACLEEAWTKYRLLG
jgi:amino acid adenylation domain-containing protein